MRTATLRYLIAAFIATGCSRGDDSKPSPPSSDNAATEAAATASIEPAAKQSDKTMPAAHREAVDKHKRGHKHGDKHGHGHGHGHGNGRAEGHFEHRFERADDWVARFDDPKRDEWQKPARVVELLGIEPAMKVADIGAGTGYFLPHLARAVGDQGQVLALDIEADMVRYMKERARREGLANVSARAVEPGDPGLERGSLDRILIVNTWHHIAERPAYADKLRQALSERGTLAIIDFTKDAPYGPPPAHRLPPAAVVAELERAGFRAEAIAEDLPHQYIVVGHAGKPETEKAPR